MTRVNTSPSAKRRLLPAALSLAALAALYTLDKDPTDFDKPFEELSAAAAQRGFRPPDLIRGDNIIAGGVRLGAVGISGDGVDQDDLIAADGADGYEPPAAVRADQVIVRGTRLPFLRFPRSPNL